MRSRRSFIGSALGIAAFTAASRTFALAQTPSTSAAIDPDLWSYLSLSPTSIANLGQALPLLAGNQRLQADTLNIDLPFDMANPDQMHAWIQGMMNVALPSFILQNTMRDDFTDLTGFDITQIASGAEIGEPPNMATFLRGTFDPFKIQLTQLGLGYQPVEVGGHSVMSLFPDAELDLNNPVQSIGLARMNNSTVLDDGTLVYASTLDLIEQVLAPEPTLATVPEVQRAIGTLDGPLITSALLGPGNFLPSIPMEIFQPQSQDEISDFILSMQTREQMPIVLAAIAGSTPGGPVEIEGNPGVLDLASQPTSLSKFALVYAIPEEAERAAPLIENGLATGNSVVTNAPWTEVFTSWSAVPNPAQSSVLLTIEWSDGAARPLQLIFARDLGFITG